MTTRTILEISTAHLPPKYRDDLTAQEVIADKLRFGWLLYVPYDESERRDEDIPAEILAIQSYARSKNCAYVLLDRDADEDENLPTWNED